MAYINSTRTVVNNVGTDIALAGAGNLFTVSGSLGGTKSLTLSDGFINNGAPEANLIVPLLFPNGHNDLGPSLYLEITVAGVTNPIPVVSNQNGTLAPIPHHEMTEGGSTVYKVVDPNTILNVYYTADYDGSQNPAFVVVGNPLVLSSSTYSIYANGFIELWLIAQSIAAGNTGTVLNFPVSFSTVDYCTAVSVGRGSTNASIYLKDYQKDKVTAFTANGYGNNLTLFACGY